MNSIRIWMTTFVKDYDQILISFLIKKGFSVSSLADDNNTVGPSNDGLYPIYVIALQAVNAKFDFEKINSLIDEIENDFYENKRSYYSLIIQQGNPNEGAAWISGRIFLPETQKNGSPYRSPPDKME